MGDLGMLRRPPRGWLEGRAVSVRHSVATETTGESSSDWLDTSYSLSITWEVRLPGREPYRVEDRRKCPTWTTETFFGGSGKRWFGLRLRKSYGLVDGVEGPVRVDPDDADRLWVDWDAWYAAHEVAWDRRSAVDKAVATREGGIDGLVERLTRPMAPEVRPDDEPLVEAELARRRAEREGQLAASAALAESAQAAMLPGDAAERQTYLALAKEWERLGLEGTRCPAQVVSVVDTERTLVGVPVLRLTLDLAAPESRQVVIEVPLHRRAAKRYREGRHITVAVDPANAANVGLL